MSPDNIKWPLPVSSGIIVKSTLEMVYILGIRFSNSKWLNSKDTGSNMAPFTFFCFCSLLSPRFFSSFTLRHRTILFTRLH